MLKILLFLLFIIIIIIHMIIFRFRGCLYLPIIKEGFNFSEKYKKRFLFFFPVNFNLKKGFVELLFLKNSKFDV